MISTLFDQLNTVLSDDSDSIDKSLFEETLLQLYSHRNSQVYKTKMSNLRKNHKVISSTNTMQGRAFCKPYGYAGDFEIIDKIYVEYTNDNLSFKKWDEYFQSQKAPIAVRNRKRYFLDKLRTYENLNKQFSVLNLASGPCRDLLEHYNHFPKSKIHFDCVDLDRDAISFASKLLDTHKTKVEFINQNIYRYKPTKHYDLVWSAGLFDYFTDEVFTKILSRFLDFNPSTKIIIGNFSDANPTVPYMEIIGEWYLNYRSEEKLRSIAVSAGADARKINIEREPEGVNLFLNINC